MAFANIPERQEFESKFKRPSWMRLDPGQYIIRILDDGALTTFKHWVRGNSLKCIGDGCPVCENNSKIIEEHGDDYRDVPGYSPRSARFSTNVLDKTPVLVCPECDHKNNKNTTGQFPTTCQKCRTVLPDNLTPEPVNEVKILERGSMLFDQFNLAEETINDPLTSPLFANGDNEKKRYSLRDIDFALVVKGTGNNKTTTPMAIWNSVKDTVPEVEKFDLETAALELSRDEMIDVMNGVSVRDVLVARNSSSSMDNSDKLLKEVKSDLSSSVNQSLKDLGFNEEDAE